MELSKTQKAANKIADSMVNGIRLNLQEFDSEINMFDVAIALVMASTRVLDIMYECSMSKALVIMRDAVNKIGIKATPEN